MGRESAFITHDDETDTETGNELVIILSAISLVSKRLAKKLILLEQWTEKEEIISNGENSGL